MPSHRPTIHDVAARSGMSKSLVSLALRGSPNVSESSRATILRAAAELGYRPNAAARSLAVRRSQTIGVLVLDLHNPVFAEILDGVQSEFRAHGFTTMLVSGGDDPQLQQSEIDTLMQFQVEGLILIAHRLTEATLRSLALEVPTVVVTRDDIRVPRLDTVSNDDIAGAERAVDHLVQLGHSRIGFLTGGNNPVSLRREEGYRRAMARHGLSDFIHVVPGGLTDSAGYSAASAALGASPTALFVVNDIAALGAIAAIEEAGLRVPEDVSVIGYDGIALGGLRSVNLTTIGQPLIELGRRAAQQILHRIEHSDAAEHHILVESQLIERGTTARLTQG